MSVISFLGSFILTFTRFTFDLAMTIYMRILVAYFVFVDLIARFSTIFFAFELDPENSDEFLGWVEGSLDAEREEALYYYDEYVVPVIYFYVSFLYSKTIVQIFWFFCFIIPFSHLVNASLTNEYLLFCCITFTIFLLYDSLVDLISSFFAPSLDALRSLVSKKLYLLLQVTYYQDQLLAQYKAAEVLFEEFASLAAPMAEEDAAADEVIFDQSLSAAAFGSLQAALFVELRASIQQELIEMSEFELVVLEELIHDLFDETAN